MARTKKTEDRPLASAKLWADAMEAAKIAASMKGTTVQDFISEATLAASQEVIEAFAKKVSASKKGKGE